MIKRISTQQHKPKKEWTALHLLGIIFAITALVVLFAILFAPDKPPPPPPSKTSYEAKPVARDGELPPVPEPRRRGRRQDEPAQLASGPEPTIEAGEGCLVQGVVKDKKTGKPIAFAQIGASIQWAKEELLDEEHMKDMDRYQRHKSTFATSAGKYAMRLTVPGKYAFNIYSNNYLPERSETIELAEDAETYTLDFALSSGASISGRITEHGTGLPAADMSVWANAERTRSATADSGEDGYYTLSGLVPGVYTVTVDLRGSSSLHLDFGDLNEVMGGAKSISSVEREVVIKTDDEQVRNVDFTVEPSGQVWGYVLTYDNEAVSGSDIVLCASTTIIRQVLDMVSKQKAPLTGGSNREGYYEIVGVPLNKEWRLFTFPDKHAPQLTDPFLLTPTQRVARIDIYVSRGSDVYGVVVDPDRKPLPDADLYCLPATSALLAPLTFSQTFENTKSEDDGSFVFSNIPTGDYQVMAHKEGYKYTTSGEPFRSDGKNDVTGMQVVLSPVEKGTMTIYGTVTDSSGAPISGVRIDLGGMGAETLGEGLEQDTTTDSEGKYAFYEINTGFYLLIAHKDGYERKTVGNVKYDEPTDIVLEAATYISGVVRVRETGVPPEYFTVRAIPSGSSGVMSMIDAIDGQSFSTPDGRFEISVKPGDYTLEARASGYTPGRTDVSVSVGSPATGVVIEISQSGGRIAGRVVTSDAKSAAGAVVALSEAGEVAVPLFGVGTQGSVQTGPDGEFAFERLGAGTYGISVRLEGYAPTQYGPVTLADRQAVTGIEIRLDHGNVLQGYVSFNGRLEPGAMVTVVGNGITELATADANGQYRFDSLPAGSFVGSAVSLNNITTGSFAPLHGRIEVIAGQNNVYNFGEPTNTALAVLCTPPPPSGSIGFALLLFPGAPQDLVALNLTNPASWFQDSSELAAYVAGMAQIDRDGYFRMDNLIQGEYRLDILYTSIGEIMSGSVSLVHSGPVVLQANRLNELDLGVGTR